jgi:hypothetical protein
LIKEISYKVVMLPALVGLGQGAQRSICYCVCRPFAQGDICRGFVPPLCLRVLVVGY